MAEREQLLNKLCDSPSLEGVLAEIVLNPWIFRDSWSAAMVRVLCVSLEKNGC